MGASLRRNGGGVNVLADGQRESRHIRAGDLSRLTSAATGNGSKVLASDNQPGHFHAGRGAGMAGFVTGSKTAGIMI